MTEVQAILFGSVIAGAFTVVGAYIGYRLSTGAAIESIRVAEFNQAASNLRSSFAKILAGIRTRKLPTEADLRNFAATAFDTHAIEMERFRFYVPDYQKEEYDKACAEYYNMVSLRPLNHGADLPADKFYIKKVEEILKFAKP